MLLCGCCFLSLAGLLFSHCTPALFVSQCRNDDDDDDEKSTRLQGALVCLHVNGLVCTWPTPKSGSRTLLIRGGCSGTCAIYFRLIKATSHYLGAPICAVVITL